MPLGMLTQVSWTADRYHYVPEENDSITSTPPELTRYLCATVHGPHDPRAVGKAGIDVKVRYGVFSKSLALLLEVLLVSVRVSFISHLG